jgi:hypothetical protein
MAKRGKGDPNAELTSNPGQAIFPSEEKLRGRSRTGKFIEPKPQFVQPPDIRDTGARLTYDHKPPVKEGNLKFETDIWGGV